MSPVISLGAATGTIDLPASEAVIELENYPLTGTFDFHEAFTLVRENGDVLVNQNGDTLIAQLVRANARVNIIDLGA